MFSNVLCVLHVVTGYISTVISVVSGRNHYDQVVKAENCVCAVRASALRDSGISATITCSNLYTHLHAVMLTAWHLLWCIKLAT